MKISQLARNHQMMYQFIHRDNSYASKMQPQAGISSLTSPESSAESLLEKMGMRGLEGRTVREMARYKLEHQEKPQASPRPEGGLDLDTLLQQAPARPHRVPLSDEATAAMQKLALQDARNSVGSGASPSAEERVTLIQDQLKQVAPSKRAAAFHTMNQVWQSELDRIGAYIKKNDPSWSSWGDKFDPSILDNYKPGIDLWV